MHLACIRALLLLPLLSAASIAQAPSGALPSDSAVRQGVLPNGLRYLVRHNGRPEHRAELRLVVNAGSILETDAQRGVAHFVEHMAFNGTRRFPKSSIVNFLERIGMRFGADVNAYTSFDETVYMLQVPTDTARLLNTGLDILEDWAQAIAFDSTEVRKERGVVIEEWRTGRNASTRVQNRQLPAMLRGSRYAERLPIGTRENLEHFPDSVARAFYRDWYRPDLMTVIAVGDFDADTMVQAIRGRFGPIPAAQSPRPRTYAEVPGHDDTIVSIESDKEYPSSSVALLWLRPRDSTRSVQDYRRNLVAGIYDAMVNARLAELSQRPDAAFAYAGSGRGAFVRTRNAYQLFAVVKESGFAQAAAAVLSEAERIARFGFTQSEVDRVRTNYLRGLEQAYAERDKTNSANFAGQYVAQSLSGDPLLSIGQTQALAEELLPTVMLPELNALARSSFTEHDRVVLVAAPGGPDVRLPDRTAMLNVFAQAKAATLSAYVDSASDAPLVPVPPTPGRIVRERTLTGTNILEWTLSNGGRVLLKPTDFKADEVLLGAQRAGGESLVPDADVLDAQLSDIALSSAGLGQFNKIALGKRLTGKRVSVSTGLDETMERVRGTASSKDLETLFQLTWLRLTAPRVDSSAWIAAKNQFRAALINQRNSPESVFDDTITVTMAQHHPREHLMSPEVLDSVNLRRMLAVHNERFAAPADFTFFLVGSFSPDSVRPLVARYLASLPGGHRAETPRDNGINPPAGVVSRTVRRGVEPKAQTRLIFSSPCRYSYVNRVILAGLEDLLEIRLREALREDKGGTYGVDVSAHCSAQPVQRASVSVSFGSAPERTEELVAAMYAVIDGIKAGAISDSNMTKLRQIRIRAHETQLRQNGAWLNAMMDADEDQRDQRDFLRLPALVAGVTTAQLRDAARRYLRKEQVARFTLLPESTAPVKP